MIGEVRAPDAEPPPEAAEPLPADPDAFWRGKPLPEGWLPAAVRPKVTGALPKRLGNLQFWRGEKALQEALAVIYASASGDS